MQLKTFKTLALSFTLSAVCCAANVQAQNSTALSTIADECVMGARGCKNKNNSNNELRPLRFSDFAGQFILGVDSLGGIGALTPIVANETVGTARTVDGHVTFDRSGSGVIDFGSASIYGGSVGSVLFIPDISGTVIEITIIDRVLGVGSLHITNPTLLLDDLVDFVTVRSSDTGKVLRIEGHRTNAGITENSISTYTIERAQQ